MRPRQHAQTQFRVDGEEVFVGYAELLPAGIVLTPTTDKPRFACQGDGRLLGLKA